MQITTTGIVLSKIKYGDNNLIVTCYTQKLGTQSFLLRGALKNKKGKINASYFQYLAQLQLEVSLKNNRSLQSLKEVSLQYVYQTIYTNFSKSTIVLFIAEVLTNILRQEEVNPTLYEFLQTALQWLDTQKFNANFHLLFLLKLTKHIGFYPNTNNINFNYFHLEEGKFLQNKEDKYTITGQNLVFLKQFLGINFDALSNIKMNASQRQSFLSVLLLYFQLHLPNFKKPKSLTILNQVFN